ncbi:MAG TPA: nucleoside deaminase [Longimicrobiales bacterium]|nr:nucleoside deaminase [Longimicrobiales bacterium]
MAGPTFGIMLESQLPEVRIACPAWAATAIDWTRNYASAEARMGVALACARANVAHETGGPFGAAIFDASGTLVSVGVNLVVPLNNSSLHAEIVAFMMAQATLSTYTLAAAHLPAHELYTSCEPCAMCLGAVLWSGVRHVAWSALRDDANRLNFDEGPVFAASYHYLRARGISFEGGVLRAQGRAILESYEQRGGTIYNA